MSEHEPMTKGEIDAVRARVTERQSRAASGWGVASDDAQLLAELNRRQYAIVASANDVPHLLADNEWLRAEVERLQGELATSEKAHANDRAWLPAYKLYGAERGTRAEHDVVATAIDEALAAERARRAKVAADLAASTVGTNATRRLRRR